VLDKGFYINNPELKDNLFVNAAEIPSNGIDDDKMGILMMSMELTLPPVAALLTQHSHGSGVMGIVGAQGNNSLGMSGVNWNVKLLAVSNAVSSVSLLIKGYEYVKELRRKFNESGGQEGHWLLPATSLQDSVINGFLIFGVICMIHWVNMASSVLALPPI
jgi:hypothetical protein